MSEPPQGRDARPRVAEARPAWVPGATAVAGEQSPDQPARTRALDPAQSFIVRAPAGSGKTGLLVQRHLALLPVVDVPEEIVAITFTRKAAGEMRERILAALAEAHRGEAVDPHLQRTRTLARRALEHDARRGWDLQANPGRLRVLTIDALCASLVRQMPWLSHFGGEPRVVDDARALHRQAARETLGQLEGDGPWGEAVATVLWHLDNDPSRCERMLVDLLARRDQWLRHVAGPFSAGEAQRAHLEAGLARAVRDALQALRASIPRAETASLVSVAAYAAENLAAAGSSSAIRACRGLDGLPGTEPQDLPVWLGLSELLLTRRGAWRARHTAEHGLPARRNGEGARMRREARRLCTSLAAHDELRARLGEVRDLPATRYSDAQWQVLQALAGVLHLAAAMLRVVFAERGEVDHVEVAQAALQALGDEEAPTELALALDHRIRHVLVDEFQDTSYSQCELLRRLVAGWSPGDGRSLFLVGDPMQSIYRFREADVGLYLRAWERGFGGLVLEPLHLQANFRAQGQLVSWVNRVFAEVFPRRADANTGAVPWQSAVALRASAPPGASVHPLLDPEPESEAALVVRLVQAAMACHAEGRIAILARSRGHLGAILPALRAAGIDYRGVELEGLAARPAVQDLLALTRALLHPADRVAWLALLRAPWCALSLRELHTLTAHDASRTVLELLRDPERLAALGPEGAARAQRVLVAMESALARRGSRPLVQAVAEVWTALGGPACVETPDLEDAGAYLDLLGQWAPGEALDPQRMSERLETLFASVRSPGAQVEVMTIHKAKGLEFDTVILPGLGRATRVDERRLLSWAERPAGAGPPDLLLAPMAPAGEAPDAISRYLWKLEASKSEHETTRLLYVAVTRAREHLHLIGHAAPSADGTPTPDPGSLLQCIWPAVRGEFERVGGERERPPRETRPGERTPAPLRRLPAAWRPPPPPRLPVRSPAAGAAGEETPAAGVAYDWAGRTARCVGTVVHQVLCHIGRDGAEAWDRRRVQRGRRRWEGLLVGLGVSPGELAEAGARVEQALVNVLEDPRGRWILDARHADARSEYALSGKLGARVVNAVIDRTFVAEDGVRWIVDYKTGTHEGADIETFLERERERHRAQLDDYAALMAHRERRPIRLGLYYPLLTGWREWRAAV